MVADDLTKQNHLGGEKGWDQTQNPEGHHSVLGIWIHFWRQIYACQTGMSGTRREKVRWVWGGWKDSWGEELTTLLKATERSRRIRIVMWPESAATRRSIIILTRGHRAVLHCSQTTYYKYMHETITYCVLSVPNTSNRHWPIKAW